MVVVALPARSQTQWKVPNLIELTESDQIAKGRTPLPANELKFLHHVTAHAIAACAEDPGPGDAHTAAGLLGSLSAKRVPLNNSGEHGLIVQGWGACMCGAVGNCSFWLIAERSDGFKVVLQTFGIQTFQIEKTMSNGHFDVILGSHDSASATDLSLYHYTGKYYRRAACALMSYQDDNFQPLKVPTITSQSCRGR